MEGAGGGADFEWILSNEELAPVVGRCAAKLARRAEFGASSSSALRRHAGVVSLAALGVGASHLEVYLRSCTPPGSLRLTGVDIDEAAVRRNAARVRGEGHEGVRWVVGDLGDPECVAKWRQATADAGDVVPDVLVLAPGVMRRGAGAAASAGCGRPLEFDILLDKGTLDYLICEEMPKFCSYLRNVCRMLSGHGYYILVSFRARSLLLSLLATFGLNALEEEVKYGDTEKSGVCYVIKTMSISKTGEPSVAASPGAESDPLLCPTTISMQNDRVKDILDAHFSTEQALFPESQLERIRGMGSVALAEAYRIVIPSSLQVEYSFDFFRDDLAESGFGAAVAADQMTGEDMVRYLRENQ